MTARGHTDTRQDCRQIWKVVMIVPSWIFGYQQQPNNRVLLLPFINGSQAQTIRLLEFWPAKDTIYISERNLGKTYNEKIRLLFRSKEFVNDVSNDIIIK